MSKRRKGRTGLGGVLLAVVALAVTAAVLWRWMLPPPKRVTLEGQPASVSTPGNPAAQSGEDFSAAERQRLDAILRRKSHTEQR